MEQSKCICKQQIRDKVGFLGNGHVKILFILMAMFLFTVKTHSSSASERTITTRTIAQTETTHESNAIADSNKPEESNIQSGNKSGEKTKTISSGPLHLKLNIRSTSDDEDSSSFSIPPRLSGEFSKDGLFNEVFNTLGIAMGVSALLFLLFFVGIIIIFIFIIRSNYKREKQKQEMIMRCVESGQPLPEYLKNQPTLKERYLKNAIIWMAVGVGLLFVIHEIAAIPILVGLAYLLLYFMEKKPTQKDPNEQG